MQGFERVTETSTNCERAIVIGGILSGDRLQLPKAPAAVGIAMRVLFLPSRA